MEFAVLYCGAGGVHCGDGVCVVMIVRVVVTVYTVLMVVCWADGDNDVVQASSVCTGLHIAT